MKKIALIFYILFLCVSQADAEELTIGQIISPTQIPIWIAHEAGYFEQNGITPKVQVVQGGTVAVQTLVAKQLDVLTVGSTDAINAHLKGADVVIIARNIGVFPYSLYVSQKVADPRELKGKKLAVSGLGGPSEFLTRYAVEKLGLNPQRDVTLVQVGTAQIFTSLASGVVDGAMLNPPDSLQAAQMGLKPLLDLVDSGPKFPFNNISTRRDVVNLKRDTVLRFLKGFVAGLARFHNDPAFSAQVIKKNLKTEDPVVVTETYRFWAKLFPRKPYIDKEEIETYLKMSGKQAATAESFFDNSLIAELDRQGYIDALYSKSGNK